MGSICSKSDAYSGGHTVLGPASTTAASASRTPNPNDARATRAEAAEQRLKAAQARGTHSSNPNKGKLASQAGKPVKVTPEGKQDERLVWD
ncbi:hypothetical protein DFS33DRAFT_1302847 [Desarmillaria ectypa]|nr:hypothetical protein DFS33DRAFT_1302847 [Desarmillaria ectypa]